MDYTFINFDDPITSDELIWIKKLRGDTDYSNMVCDKCGCALGHRGYQCGNECEYCHEFHPTRLCFRKRLMCEICGIPYQPALDNESQHETCKHIFNYRKLCLTIAIECCDTFTNLPFDIQRLLAKYVLFGPINKYEKCCSHCNNHNDCIHCQIANHICKSKFHCGCGKKDHIFRNDHTCRHCELTGHWSNKCEYNVLTSNTSVYKWKQLQTENKKV